VHFFRITHRDEVEPPFTDWLREAYELPDKQATKPLPKRATAKPVRKKTVRKTKAAARKKSKAGARKSTRR
jgi:hypothetical protein